MKVDSEKSLRFIKEIEHSFDLPVKGMRKIMKDFHAEMARGLSGGSSSLHMIPTYVDRPTGGEKGKFIALDLGGTNFRILEVELRGGGVSKVTRVRKFVLDKPVITGASDGFFGFIAGCVGDFVKTDRAGAAEGRNMGFTFSFPVIQTGVAAGVLAHWTKNFDVKGVLGKDVVGLLSDALVRRGLNNVKVAVLANDTVGTLVARAYEDPHCDVGVIIGTGTNACYVEKVVNIKKWKGPKAAGGRMIVNIEWGNFNRLPLTAYDERLDKSSENPGQQVLEKTVSGMYLGEVARLIMADMIKQKMIFGGRDSAAFDKKYHFRSEYLSAIEDDGTRDLSKTARLLKDMDIKDSSLEDRRLVRRVAETVSLRAVRVSAAAIAAVVTKTDPGLKTPHTIAVDGTVYEKHPKFSSNMKRTLKELLGPKAARIKTVLTKDGSGKGAAILAAVVAS